MQPLHRQLCQELLRQRYLAEGRDGHAEETRASMLMRVARAVATAEANYLTSQEDAPIDAKQFYRAMSRCDFLPNSPTLMNAGHELGMLSACFVLPVNDSVEGIFESVKAAALIQKAGGGTGFAFDSLRPTGDRVASSGGTTSGPISFMRVFAEATRAIQQGAFRRGANMGMMSVQHPDILKFITAKGQPGVFGNFNLSVKITDAFMRALKQRPESPHVVTNPRDGNQYIIPRNVDIQQYGVQHLLLAGTARKRCYTVAEVWNLIVRSAHARGEPGLCFIDRVNRDNPTPLLGRLEATNPCGEQPLLAYESCNLGSINLMRFLRPDGGGLDWGRLAKTIRLAVRFLDDVIDVNHYPVAEIGQVALGNRKIGLGVMGFADTLVLLGIRYDSEEAARLAGDLARFLGGQKPPGQPGTGRDAGMFPELGKQPLGHEAPSADAERYLHHDCPHRQHQHPGRVQFGD